MRLARILLLFFTLPAFGAGFEAGIRHLVVKPAGDSGDLEIPLSRGFAATAEVFWTARVSTQVAASFVNPEAILTPANAEPVDLGTLGLDTYAASVRYHFAPDARVSAFAGAGAALVSIGDLDDQFGDAVEVEFGSETAFLAEAGVRYRLLPRLFIDATLSYMPLTADGEGRGDGVPRELGLDPVTFSAGASWRF
jgi:outer membrane protein W